MNKINIFCSVLLNNGYEKIFNSTATKDNCYVGPTFSKSDQIRRFDLGELNGTLKLSLHSLVERVECKSVRLKKVRLNLPLNGAT